MNNHPRKTDPPSVYPLLCYKKTQAYLFRSLALTRFQNNILQAPTAATHHIEQTNHLKIYEVMNSSSSLLLLQTQLSNRNPSDNLCYQTDEIATVPATLCNYLWNKSLATVPVQRPVLNVDAERLQGEKVRKGELSVGGMRKVDECFLPRSSSQGLSEL